MSLSADGRTGVITGGADASPNAMVAAADALRWSPPPTVGPGHLRHPDRGQRPLGGLQHSQPQRHVAFGDAVLAGDDGHLGGRLRQSCRRRPVPYAHPGRPNGRGRGPVLTTQVTPVSIWALNFALMFALALGIDYALFLVVRFRAALKRRGVQTGDQAGRGRRRSPRPSTPPAKRSHSAP